MQQVAQDWLVLRLSGRALPVGIATALQFLPVLLFGFWAGLAADRLDKRRLLVAAQSAMGALALVLGLLILTGTVRLWMVYVLAALLAMDPARLQRGSPAPRRPGQVRDGIRYVWATPVLRSTLLLVAVVGTLSLNSRVVLPLLARFTYNGGANLYGTLASVMAVGSVVGALGVARRARPTRRLLLGAATAFGVSASLAAVAPSVGTELVALCLLGGTSIAFLSTANSTLQLSSSARMRGRVMALYGLLFLGTTPLGSLLVGWLAERYGPRSGLVLAGAGALVAVAVAALSDLLHSRRATPDVPAGQPAIAPSPGEAA